MYDTVKSNLRIAPKRLINAKLNTFVQAKEQQKKKTAAAATVATFEWAAN